MDKKYFACIHVDDIHNPEVFFTYDTEDIDLIKEEIKDADIALQNIPKGYTGSITHLLSLRYVDSKIKYLYDSLKNKGLLDNTILVVTADHGFSFAHNPLRESGVTNFYLENFKIPLFIFDGCNKFNNSNLVSSKKIPLMLKNILKNQQLKYEHDYEDEILRIQYCGGGCPDIQRRELYIASFDKQFFVSCKIHINEVFSYKHIYQIFNLKNDPKQLKNLKKNKKLYFMISYLIDDIKCQIKEIKESLYKKEN